MRVEVNTYSDEDALIIASFELSICPVDFFVRAEFVSAYEEGFIDGTKHKILTEIQLRQMDLFDELEQDAINRWDEREHESDLNAEAADLRIKMDKEDSIL